MEEHPSFDALQWRTRGLEEQQIYARVAWLYFEGGQTQQEIADQLGLTRLRVNKILGILRAEGAIVVNIRLPLANCVALEVRLKQVFGLDDVQVVPSFNGVSEQQRVIGHAAGAMLEPMLQDGQGIGVGWGKTLAATLQRLTPSAFPNSWVSSLMGGLTRGAEWGTFDVAIGYARLLQAECYHLVGPLYFPSAESRELLLKHQGIRETLIRASRVSVAVVSCGDLSDRSQLAKLPSVRENMAGLRGAGAVGDFMGTFLDAEGNPVRHPLNDCVLSLGIEEVRKIPISILASGGVYKAPIMYGILKAGYVRRLVTDEQCATALLQKAEGEGQPDPLAAQQTK